MYVEIKTDDPQPIVDLVNKLIADGVRAQLSISRSGELLRIEAAVNESEPETTS